MAYSAPRTWVTGELVTAAYMNQEVRDNLNAQFPLAAVAWSSYTPTLTQSVTVTATVTYAKYMQIGKIINVNVLLTVTGAGTLGADIFVTLPVTAAASFSNLTAVGAGRVFDTSASLNYVGTAVSNTTARIGIVPNAGNGYLGSTSFTAALAAGDTVSFCATYEAA